MPAAFFLLILAATPGWLAPVLTFISSTAGALIVAVVALRNARTQAAQSSRQSTLSEIQFNVDLLKERADRAERRVAEQDIEIDRLRVRVNSLVRQLQEASHG